MKALEGGRINIASCSLGGAAFCIEAAKLHLQNRRQFGNPLSQFQNLQFKLADMATDLVTSRLLVRKAATLYPLQNEQSQLTSSMGKLRASQLCYSIADSALQMHGGYGYLTEYGIEKYVRDLRAHMIAGGSVEMMKLVVARKLLTQRE